MLHLHKLSNFCLLLSLLTLTSCAGSNNQQEVEKYFAPDPNLPKDGVVSQQITSTSSPMPIESNQTKIASPSPTINSSPASSPTMRISPTISPTPNLMGINPIVPTTSPTPTTQNVITPLPSPLSTNNQVNISNPLQKFITDLEQLGVLNLQPGVITNDIPTPLLEPEKNITRREFVRWLVMANNKIYADNPARQIRLAHTNSSPAFNDVPATDPDFPIIQGLAEAGLITSSLIGVSKVSFNPDDLLNREQMLIWKVPLDTRKPLPPATEDIVVKKWGFQDVEKLSDKALGAVLVDYDNGDLSNIRRVFGFTTLLQPQKIVSRGEAAAAIWFFGQGKEGRSAAKAIGN